MVWTATPTRCIPIMAGGDPLQARYPTRGFPAAHTLQGAPSLILDALLAELGPRKPAAPDTVRRCAAIRAADLATVQTPPTRMTMAWASTCLDRARAPDSLLVNGYPLIRPAMRTTRPGSVFGRAPAGALGWGMPAAMGAKLAAPGREVVAALGDGSPPRTSGAS